MSAGAPLAAVAFTPRGAEAGLRLRQALPETAVWVPRHLAADLPGASPYDGARRLLAELVPAVGGLVLFCAAGAAVRLLAPLLRGKEADPAAVVVDEACRFAVSLLGGHAAGANELAVRVATALGATPVVTTATDAAGLPLVDLLGRAAGWRVEAAPRAVAAALLSGAPVDLLQEAGVPVRSVDGWPDGWPTGVVQRRRLAELGPRPALVVTDRLLPPGEAWAVYRPPSLVAGVGCVRGTPAAAIGEALQRRCREAGLSPLSLAVLASVETKADEPGIREAAAGAGLRLTFLPAADLAAMGVPNPSEAVRRAVGTPSVSEAAALAASGGGELVAPKRVYGDVTVALARLRPAGRLALVGLGPGDASLLVPAARRELEAAAWVLGYRRYLALLRPWLHGPALRAYELGEEADRAAQAVVLARDGARVALVSGGDAGVYGMAAPAFEALEAAGWDGRSPEVVVVPGVTAATAAAALLGAPLGDDFVAVSLSDLHTPWEVIERRLQAAAAADLAVVIYNPRSRRRAGHLARAAEVLLRHRAASTPVGIVRAAHRPGQSVRLTTLGQLAAEPVDMETTVMVGASHSRIVAGRLVSGRPSAQPTATGNGVPGPVAPEPPGSAPLRGGAP